MITDYKAWIKAASIRAIKTLAQTAVATIGTSAMLGEVSWAAVALCSVAGLRRQDTQGWERVTYKRLSSLPPFLPDTAPLKWIEPQTYDEGGLS